MMKYFLITALLIACLLSSCVPAVPQMTVTLTLAPSKKSAPLSTEVPTATPMPTLGAEEAQDAEKLAAFLEVTYPGAISTLYKDTNGQTLSIVRLEVKGDDGASDIRYIDVTTGEVVDARPEALMDTLLRAWYFEPDFIERFDAVMETTIDGKPAVIGLLPDGSVQTLAQTMDMVGVDGQSASSLVRVAEHRDTDGFARSAFINTELGFGNTGAVQLNPDTAAATLWDTLAEQVAKGQGTTPDEIKAKWKKDGTVTLPIATGIPGVEWEVQWTESITFDPNQPMEIILIGSMEQFEQLPKEWQEQVMGQHVSIDEGQIVNGGLITSQDGRLIIIGVDHRRMENWFNFIPTNILKFAKENRMNENQLRLNFRDALSDFYVSLFGTFQYPESGAAFTNARHASWQRQAGLIFQSFSESWLEPMK